MAKKKQSRSSMTAPKPDKKKRLKRIKGAKGNQVPGTTDMFQRTYKNEDPVIQYLPPKSPDFEETAPMPDDEAAKHRYPPPKKHPIFRQVWMEFIDSLVSRENFKIGHLRSLEALCDLWVDYEDTRKFLREHGTRYKSTGRAGVQWKFFPEVGQLNTIYMNISKLMHSMSLNPSKKDNSGTTGEAGTEQDDWT